MSGIYKIKYLTEAERDLKGIIDYILQVNPSAAIYILQGTRKYCGDPSDSSFEKIMDYSF